MKHAKTVLLLGSGALKIGEAGEFDYSGTQAIKALKEEGRRVVLVNPNIATIQTSEGLADRIYFLPVTADFVERVIAKEKPDGIVVSFGGQTALNCGIELSRRGIFKKYNVPLLGTPIDAIICTEDRKLFAQRLNAIHLKTAKGKTVTTKEAALAFAQTIGYPVMLRVGFALGGSGSGVARNPEQLEQLATNALATSPQLIIEEDLTGWKEVEYEVVRDSANNCITVCNMENFDPVGIHTGESIVVAPSQTLTNHEYYTLRHVAIQVIRELKIVGECNIQFALDPHSSDYRIIEVNARLSRSSALASKATGYPLAYVAAKLALGKNLPELTNTVTKKTSAFFEPSLDYIVVKMPRWDLDKYTHVESHIGSEMKSVGEVMSIARSFEEAIQKAARMRNDGYAGVIDEKLHKVSKHLLRRQLQKPDPMRLFTICAALRGGMSVKSIHAQTGIDCWFLAKLQSIVDTYSALRRHTSLTKDLMLKAKQHGFSDKQLAHVVGSKEQRIRQKRKRWSIVPQVKRIDTMAGEFPARTNYLYMTYQADTSDQTSKQSKRKQQAIVLGCGPYAIGTSVEFDWCAVNTLITLRQNGLQTIMINCNPETVSTDYDMSDTLYFEELTLERVLDIYDLEQAPCILSVGGQIPNNLAAPLDALHVPILGTPAGSVFQAEHRKSFSTLLDSLHIPQPAWARAHTSKQTLAVAASIGYPVLIRPSFVLSGKAMCVMENEEQLCKYMEKYPVNLQEHPFVLTKFLRDATECDFDGVAQKGTIITWTLSEHVESGGVHSGDSTLMLPSSTLSQHIKDCMHKNAAKIVRALAVNGPFNIQFLVEDDTPYVIECNLRASRSIPFVSKTLGVNFIRIATEIALGKKYAPIQLRPLKYQAVKVPQFSFHKLRGSDPTLRVEMSSTGEVAAFGRNIFDAYLKGILATGVAYPTKKAALISLGGAEGKLHFLESCRMLHEMGYTLYATSGTSFFLKENDISCRLVGKAYEGIYPNAADLLREKKIDFAVITPAPYSEIKKTEMKQVVSSGYILRRMAVDLGIPIFTNPQTAHLFVQTIKRYTPTDLDVLSWNEYQKARKSRTAR